MYNFIEQCLRGEVLLEDIDDFVDEWHDNDSEEPLYAYLGMTSDEYSHWLEDSDNLPFIISARKYNISYEEAVSQAAVMAARADTISKTVQIQEWLKGQGLDA